MRIRRLTDYLAYFMARLVLAVLQALPITLCEQLADAVAWLAFDLLQIRGRIVDENLRRAFAAWSDDQRAAVGRGMWRHLVLMTCEVAHAPRKIHLHNWRGYATLQGARNMTRLLLSERPTLLVSGHYGNFELGGYVAGLLGFPTYTMVRPLDNPFLDAWMKRFRQKRGQHLLPKIGSAPLVDRILRDGGVMAVLGDQDAGPKGCFVNFLGTPASYHKAIALFSLTSGAPMAVMFARRLRPMRFSMGLAAVVDPAGDPAISASVLSLTQWYNDRLEEIILADPQQYWWVHRRWKTAPRKRKSAGRTGPDQRAA